MASGLEMEAWLGECQSSLRDPRPCTFLALRCKGLPPIVNFDICGYEVRTSVSTALTSLNLDLQLSVGPLAALFRSAFGFSLVGVP